MGLFEVVTVVFVVLKLVGVIGWSWWLVFLPTLIHLGVALFLLALIFWATR